MVAQPSGITVCQHAPCLIGMETCVSENAPGQDARLML
jgi:hypothetical protein